MADLNLNKHKFIQQTSESVATPSISSGKGITVVDSQVCLPEPIVDEVMRDEQESSRASIVETQEIGEVMENMRTFLGTAIPNTKFK